MKIVEPGPRISAADIESLEQFVGTRLPDSYREFLLTYNGGIPDDAVIDIDGLLGSPTDVQLFFGLNDAETQDIRWYFQEFPNLLAAWVIPIATDSGGNLFLIRLAGPRAGTVIYLDEHESEFMVARSFTDFIALVRGAA